MNTQRGRRLAGGRGNGGADLERGHSASTVPQARDSHDSRVVISAPDAGSAGTGTSIDLDTSRLLYKPRDTARLLSVSPAHLYRELQRGALESMLVGGRCRRISRAALERYIARLEEEGAQ